MAIAASLGACDSRDTPPPHPSPKPVDPDSAPLDWTRPIVDRSRTDGFIGDQACAPCHADIATRYAKHSMANTGVRAIETQPWVAALFDAGAKTNVKHASSGFSYRPIRRGTRYFVEETLLAADGGAIARWQEPVTHVYSAGTYGLAFYSRRGKQFVHLPIDYYGEAKRWDLDPMAFGGNPRFGSVLESFCVSCHSDDARAKIGFADTMPRGIGCERCHGPGKRHAETLKPEDVFNPHRAPAKRQLEVCSQCHESAFPILRDGKDHYEFHPGDKLDEFRVSFFAEPVEADRFKLLAHSERLVLSACWRGAPDKMTCTSCHDPHQSSTTKPASWWDDKCMGCHTRQSCTEKPEPRAKVGDHCPKCHMRKGLTANLPLVSVTDHWIQTRPPPIKPGQTAPVKTLVPWSEQIHEPVTGGDMPGTIALGYFDAGLKEEALRRALAAVKTHPTAGLYSLIGTAYIAQKRIPDAKRAYAAALRLDPDHRASLLSYAQIALDTHDPVEALHALDRLVAINPEDVGALETRAVFEFLNRNEQRAFTYFHRALDTGRATGQTYVGLALEASMRGDKAKELEFLERAWREEPRDSWILEQLTRAAAASGNKAKSADVARRKAAVEKLTPPPSRTRTSGWVR